MEMAARERAHQLGITAVVWQQRQCCDILSSEQAILCLLVVDHNIGRTGEHVARNATAFINMIRSEAQQTAVLDCLLGELIGFTRGQRDV